MSFSFSDWACLSSWILKVNECPPSTDPPRLVVGANGFEGSDRVAGQEAAADETEKAQYSPMISTHVPNCSAKDLASSPTTSAMA